MKPYPRYLLLLPIFSFIFSLISCDGKEEISKEEFVQSIYGKWKNQRNLYCIVSGKYIMPDDTLGPNGFKYEFTADKVKFWMEDVLKEEDAYEITERVQDCAGNESFQIRSPAVFGSNVLDVIISREDGILKLHYCMYDTSSGDPHWNYLIQEYEKE